MQSIIAELFIGALTHDILQYSIGAGGVYAIVNVILARRISFRKVRADSPPASQIRKELCLSARTVVIFAMVGAILSYGAGLGVFNLYGQLEDYGYVYFAISLIAVIVAHDAYFYWIHRLMHRRKLYRSVHAIHHRSYNPSPFTSYSFNVFEAFLHTLFLPLILLIVPLHPLTILTFGAHMMLRNAIGHCGYELFPANASGRPLFDWLTTVTHHDMHHERPGTNFGFYFTWWDRLMKTEDPLYYDRFRASVSKAKTVTASAVIMIMTGSIVLQTSPVYADEPLRGAFGTPGLGMVLNFEACEEDPDLTCGRLIWHWEDDEFDSVSVGDVILTGLRSDNGAWVDGRLTNPSDGWVYDGTVERTETGDLRVEGCAGPFCSTQTWVEMTRFLGPLQLAVEQSDQ